jgi:hypothetical protein
MQIPELQSKRPFRSRAAAAPSQRRQEIVLAFIEVIVEHKSQAQVIGR